MLIRLVRLIKKAILCVATIRRMAMLRELMSRDTLRPFAYQPKWLLGWTMVLLQDMRRPENVLLYRACRDELATRRRIESLQRMT